MDSDFSHDPESLPALVAPLGVGFDLSVGSRYVPGGKIPNWSLGRRLISRGGNIYADVLLGLGVKDSTSGFRAYRAEILRKVDLDAVRAEGYGFQIEMVRQVLEHGGRVGRGADLFRGPRRGDRPRCPLRSWSRRLSWSPGGPCRGRRRPPGASGGGSRCEPDHGHGPDRPHSRI